LRDLHYNTGLNVSAVDKSGGSKLTYRSPVTVKVHGAECDACRFAWREWERRSREAYLDQLVDQLERLQLDRVGSTTSVSGF
jgi:hypothetical protein